jgi:hypothetical protein
VCVSKFLIKLVRMARRMFMAGILTRQLVWLLVCVCDDRGTFRGWPARAACESKRAAWIGRNISTMFVQNVEFRQFTLS